MAAPTPERYLAANGEKRCVKCETVKPVTDFYAHKSRRDGVQAICKECHKEKCREWYADNSARVKTRVTQWQADNPERKRATARASMARQRAANPEVRRAKERAWRAAQDPEKKRDKERRSALRGYGLTVESFAAMVESQRGVCKICGGGPNGKDPVLHVDHCHKTGVVRGLLCHSCNTALGGFRDDPELLRRALDYLG